MEDEKMLDKVAMMAKVVSFIIVITHLYWFCFFLFQKMGLSFDWFNDFLIKLNRNYGLFNSPLATKGIALGILAVGLLGTRGKKDEKLTLTKAVAHLLIGLVLFLTVSGVLRIIPMSQILFSATYFVVTLFGFCLVLLGGTWLSRLLQTNLKEDVFNNENESFMQETRKIYNKDKSIPNIHLKTKFYYKKKEWNGIINVVNPNRATLVLGTPGSGKSFAVINEYIRQLIEQGNTMYVYDYKFPTLSLIAYNHYNLHPEGYDTNGNGIRPEVYFINFDDPRRSHRCNPLNPAFLKDITDANESAHIILSNLNRTWIKKQGDFFVESPKILLAAIIWYLKIYEDPVTKEKGKFCTLPHVIELLNQPYEKMFKILGSYTELENYMAPFKEALEGGAMEQLQGQIASAKIPMARIISPALYWVLSGNDFTLDINNPDKPKIFCLGNNPKRETIYGVANGLFNFRIVQIINEKGKQPCGVIVDELPTMYFDKIDRLIGTARSNKISVCLGFQDFSQLEKDYGKDEMNVIVNTAGNMFAGQVLGDSAEKLSKRYGKILQERQSISINKQDTSTSISTQMDCLIPAGKIANLGQGMFVGSVAEDFSMVTKMLKKFLSWSWISIKKATMKQNIFHAQIVVDVEKISKEEKKYKDIPIIRKFADKDGNTKDKDGNCIMERTLENNYRRIKQQVVQIMDDEWKRLEDDPKLAHLTKENKG
jgi:hypothetical protein